MARLRAPTKKAKTAVSDNVHPLPSSLSHAPAARRSMKKTDALTAVTDSLSAMLDDPAHFYAPDHGLYQTLAHHSQTVYSATLAANKGELSLKDRAALLPTLLLDSFTPDQVWAQIQLLQQPLIERTRKNIARLTAAVQEAEAVASDAGDDGEEQDDSLDFNENDGADDGDVDDADGTVEDETDLDVEDGADDDDEGLEARLDDIEDEDENENAEDDFDDEEDDEADGDDDYEAEPTPRTTANSATQLSEDAFFNLDDMNKFADRFDQADDGSTQQSKNKRKRPTDSDDDDGEIFGDVDLDAELSEEDDDMADGAKYEDFFDQPNDIQLTGQSVNQMQQQEDDDEKEEEDNGSDGGDDDESAPKMDDNDEFSGYFARMSAHQREQQSKVDEEAELATLSKFQREQRLLRPKLKAIEDKLVNPKQWNQRGEIMAIDRPKDSLLDDETLEVDYAVKPKEIITAAVNQGIEDIIKKRILNQQFDDPLKKSEKNKVKKSVINDDDVDLSNEKSEKGLAEIYAESYLKAQGQSVDESGSVTSTAVKPKSVQELELAHREIDALFVSLCSELDALSQYELTPVHRVDMRVVRNNAHSDLLNREEVGLDYEHSGLAVSVSEVRHGQSKNASQMIGESEKTSDERQRNRRIRKARSRIAKRAKTDETKQTRPSDIDAALMAKQTKKSNSELSKFTQKELKEAITAKNVKSVRATTDGTSAGKSSKQFFAQLQATVGKVEADAKKEGFRV